MRYFKKLKLICLITCIIIVFPYITSANVWFDQNSCFQGDSVYLAINDRNDNTISLIYDTGKQPYYGKNKFAQDPLNSVVIGSDYRLIQIVDTGGQTIDLAYNADGLLEKIIDESREVVFTYDPDTNDLLSVTKPATPQFPGGVTKSFEYENHNVKRIKDAKNQYFVENLYDALLLVMMARECNLVPGIFVHTLGDVHIYLNHVDGLKEQLKRIPKPLPQLEIAKKPFFKITFEDIALAGYQHDAFIKFPIAV